MTSAQEIDLSSCLWTENRYWTLVSDTKTDAIIDWGDGRVLNRTDCSDKSLLSHTYKKSRTYCIKLYGTLKFYTACTNGRALEEGDKSLGAFLTKITVPGTCPIRQYAGGALHTTDDNISGGFAFAHCKKLQHISGDLFNGLVESETNQNKVDRFLWKAEALDEIPPLTLTWMENIASDQPLLRGFFNTTSITTIPDDFLTKIPIKQYDKIDLRDMFNACRNLTNIPMQGWDKFQNDITFEVSYMFARCPAITTEAPNLWETHPNAAHEATFFDSTNISNYSNIPDDWKTITSVDTSMVDYLGLI